MTAPPSKLVLVAEDDESIATLLTRALGTKYRVEVTRDGAAAIQRIGTDPVPDLLICDVMMPGANGDAVVRKLRANTRTKAVPVIFLTARGSSQDVIAGIQLGARHYVTKPFVIADLMTKVGKILGRVSPAGAALSALASAALYVLAFPGRFDALWPLAFVAYVPLVVSLASASPRRAALLGLLFGWVTSVLGFRWLLPLLGAFSGFPFAVCVLLLVGFAALQSGRFVVHATLAALFRREGDRIAGPFIAAFVVAETFAPVAFEWTLGAALHRVPTLLQVADLGGALATSLVVVVVNAAIAEVVLARRNHRAVSRPLVLAGVLVPLLTSVYGIVRAREVAARVAAAPRLRVGLVQGDVPLALDAASADRAVVRLLRHHRDLEDRGAELVVWSEGALPRPLRQAFLDDDLAASIDAPFRVPTVVGAVVRLDDRPTYANSALLVHGTRVRARYDKRVLLPFSEYLPLGELFPVLYDLSPASARFQPGAQASLTPSTTPGLAVAVCYEDVLGGGVREAVRASDAALLVNLTNDAWFGDSAEPWAHLALSQLRAAEHHRALVRATNDGVSAVIDPTGAVVASAPTRTDATLLTDVPLLRGTTLYGVVGDTPARAISLAILAFAARSRLRGRVKGRGRTTTPGHGDHPGRDD